MTLTTNPCVTSHNYQKALMHKSKPRVNPTFINHVIKVYELEQGPLGPIGVLVPSKSNFEVDLALITNNQLYFSTLYK